jgi:hypothetical protein
MDRARRNYRSELQMIGVLFQIRSRAENASGNGEGAGSSAAQRGSTWIALEAPLSCVGQYQYEIIE